MKDKKEHNSSKSTSKASSKSSKSLIDDIELDDIEDFDDDFSDEITEKEEEEEEEEEEKKSTKKEEKKESLNSKKKDSEEEKITKSKMSLGAKIAIVIIILVLGILFLLKGCNKKKEYTVKFNANGGTTVSEQIIAEDGKVKVPKDPEKEGYEFVGWYVGGKKYDFDSKVKSNLEIEAKWESLQTASVTGVTLDQTSLTLLPKDDSPLVATIEPSNAKDTGVTWKSDDESIATVDSDGKVTAVGKGSTIITVTTNDGGFKATCKVTVSEDVVKVTDISVDKSSITLGVNESEKIIPTIKPGDATNKSVTWKSDNTKVATVNSNGVITGKGEGTAIITVTTKDGDFEKTIKVSVHKIDVTGVTLSNSNTSMTIGATKQLTATVKPTNATEKDVTWKSSDTSVVSVSGNGKLTAIKPGTAIITVTTKDGGKTATCKVTVKAPVAVTGVKLSKTSLSLQEGKTATISATVQPSDAANKNVTWSSSNTGVATVSNGKIVAKKAGTATITVTTADGKKTATCVVTVTEAPASYVLILKAEKQAGTGAIAQYSISVTKNGANFTSYKGIKYNSVSIRNGNPTISSTTVNTSIKQADIVLDDGSVKATVVYR